MRPRYRARIERTGAPIASAVRTADTHWTRLRGLIGTRALEPGHGLWIRPCRQVHMFWMTYPIDAVFLDDALAVRRIVAALRPWRVSPKVPDATSVLELPAGAAAAAGLVEGDRLLLEPR